MNELITSSLSDGNVTLLFQFPKQLMGGFELKIVEWIMEYTSKYGKPPTLPRLISEFDHFVPITTPDPLGDIYERTLTKKRNIYTREFILGIQEDLKRGVDPLPHIEKLHQEIAAGASDITRYTTFDRTSYYRKPTAYPYNIPQIDRYTGGISQGDLVYTVGRLGTGKTTFSLWLVNKWLMSGRKVLFVSNENRADDVVVKIDSFLGGFNPLKKRTMAWTDDDLNRLKTVSFIASHMEGEMIIPNRPIQDTKDLTSLIYTHRPDMVVVDGTYLMKGTVGKSLWERITEISRTLKQIAEGEGVPILGIHQANRSAVGKHVEIEHVAYSDALAQDADLVLGINQEEDGTVFVECVKNRWGRSEWGMFLKFYWDSMTVKIMDTPDAMTEEVE